MTRFLPADCFDAQVWIANLVFLLCLCAGAQAQNPSLPAAHAYFIDCSASNSGDGSLEHPWNSLAAAQAHPFTAGDRIALARGSTCQGGFAPQGSGADGSVIRLTAYGRGRRPRIVASAGDRQALLLSNQEYWQIDSLDISGGNTYGVFVTGDKGTLHHLYLKNLYVHDVYGGKFRSKDNGLVVVGPSSIDVLFDGVLIDGVDAAHTNQWAGILVGGGSFPYKNDWPRNDNIHIRNSTVHDVYGDGIVLFRDEYSSIRHSAAWLTGMEPSQDVGTPNAIWTWTCFDCTVEDNEAYLTDSPGVDGGAFDIDWDDQQNTVENNYAHDTQGYCVAVFGAGYVTSESLIRDNLCIDNALSPRMAASEGAIQLSTWNGGTIRGLTVENNEIHWNPSVPGASAVVASADVAAKPIVFTGNIIESTSALIYQIKTPWQSSANNYILDGQPEFSIGGRSGQSLAALQAEGMEANSRVALPSASQHQDTLRLEALVDLSLDNEGLLSSGSRNQLILLRNLAGQYSPRRLKMFVHVTSAADDAVTNALRDLNDVYPGSLPLSRDIANFDTALSAGVIRLLSADGRVLQGLHPITNAATLGGAVRKLLGPPDYSHAQATEPTRELAPTSAGEPQ